MDRYDTSAASMRSVMSASPASARSQRRGVPPSARSRIQFAVDNIMESPTSSVRQNEESVVSAKPLFSARTPADSTGKKGTVGSVSQSRLPPTGSLRLPSARTILAQNGSSASPSVVSTRKVPMPDRPLSPFKKPTPHRPLSARMVSRTSIHPFSQSERKRSPGEILMSDDDGGVRNENHAGSRMEPSPSLVLSTIRSASTGAPTERTDRPVDPQFYFKPPKRPEPRRFDFATTTLASG